MNVIALPKKIGSIIILHFFEQDKNLCLLYNHYKNVFRRLIIKQSLLFLSGKVSLRGPDPPKDFHPSFFVLQQPFNLAKPLSSQPDLTMEPNQLLRTEGSKQHNSLHHPPLNSAELSQQALSSSSILRSSTTNQETSIFSPTPTRSYSYPVAETRPLATAISSEADRDFRSVIAEPDQHSQGPTTSAPPPPPRPRRPQEPRRRRHSHHGAPKTKNEKGL